MLIPIPTQILGVNFSKNFIPIRFLSNSYLISGTSVVKENYAVHIKIYVDVFESDGIDYDTILLTDFRVPLLSNNGGYINTDLAEIFHSYMEAKGPDFPNDAGINAKLCFNTFTRFNYQYGEVWGTMQEAESYTTSAPYIVVYGGLSYSAAITKNIFLTIRPDVADATKDRFLKLGSSTQTTRAAQPQYLYFFNTRATVEEAILKAKITFTDASELLVQLTSIELLNYRKYAFNTTFNKIFPDNILDGKRVAKYTVWLEADDEAISETQTYNVDYGYKEYVRYFSFMNSWGAMDTKITYGKASSDFELNQSEANRIRKDGYRLHDGDTVVYDINLNNQYKVATGFISRSEVIANRDFFLSKFKFRYVLGKLLPIAITSKRISELQDENGLCAQAFEYKYLYNEDSFSEEDGYDLSENYLPELPTSSGFSYTLSFVLS
jgi:hypothetical protein